MPANKKVVFERYSDSASSYVVLDTANASAFKQLYRAAKAKLKLRIRATVFDAQPPQPVISEVVSEPRKTEESVPATAPAVEDRPEQKTTQPIPGAFPTPKQMRPKPTFVTKPTIEPFAHPFILKHPTSNLSGETIKPVAQQKKSDGPLIVKDESDDNAPVPRPFVEKSQTKPLLQRAGVRPIPIPPFAVDEFTVRCNVCSDAIYGAHWHCGICECGDFDLCGKCVDGGVHCYIDDHYLIKRLIKDGKFISSTNEIVPKKTVKPEAEKEVPGAFNNETKEEHLPESLELSRTCNCCVSGKPLRYLTRLFF